MFDPGLRSDSEEECEQINGNKGVPEFDPRPGQTFQKNRQVSVIRP